MINSVYVKRTAFKALGILNSVWSKKGCVFFSENVRKPSTLSTSVSAFWNIYFRNQTLISGVQIKSEGHTFFLVKTGSLCISADLEIQKVFCLPALLTLPCWLGSGPFWARPALWIVAILWDGCSTFGKFQAWSCEIQDTLISYHPRWEATADKRLLNQYIRVWSLSYQD